MAPRSVRFGLLSWKLSNINQSLDGDQKFIISRTSVIQKTRGVVEPLVPAAFAVVSTHQPALGPHGGLWPSLCETHNEGLCPSSGNINRLMMKLCEHGGHVRTFFRQFIS
jgi:hypothetical protein